MPAQPRSGAAAWVLSSSGWLTLGRVSWESPTQKRATPQAPYGAWPNNKGDKGVLGLPPGNWGSAPQGEQQGRGVATL